MEKIFRILLLAWSFSICLMSCENIWEGIPRPGANDAVEPKFFYEGTAIEGYDAIFCDQGYVALWGNKEVALVSDIKSTEQVIYISGINKKDGVIDKARTTIIVVDSTYFPVRIATQEKNILLAKEDGEHFSCAIYSKTEGKWNEYKGLEYVLDDDINFVGIERRLTFSAADVLSSIRLANSISVALSLVGEDTTWNEGLRLYRNIKSIDELFANLNMFVNDKTEEILSVTDQFLINKLSLFLDVHLGEVSLLLKNLKVYNGTTCEVSYEISGYEPEDEGNAQFGLMFHTINNRFVKDVELRAENHEGVQISEGLPVGEFVAELYVKSAKYGFVCARTLKTFYIYDLRINRCNVKPNAKFSDGIVRFDIELYLENKVAEGHNLGYYVRREGAEPDYCDLADVDSDTLNHRLEVEREHFNYVNYDMFEARAEGYYIGTYVKTGGVLQVCDEKELQLVYDQKPDVSTGEVSSISYTKAVVACDYEGCLFWDVHRGLEILEESSVESKDYAVEAKTEDGRCEFVLGELMPNLTYSYRAYWEMNGLKSYDEQKKFSTLTSKSCTDNCHVHAVDLGLSVKWACCNVGANIPEESGGYYAWGETKIKNNYELETYDYYNHSVGSCTSIGIDIGGTAYDVAHVEWGEEWRMPTLEEMQELRSKCTWQWVTKDGVKGQLVTGPNGNSIFLPSAGYYYGSAIYAQGTRGYYWLSSLSDDYQDYSYRLYFDNRGGHWLSWSNRYYGHAVRPVME